MSLTIDQILAESRGEIESPTIFNTEKEASAQPSVSSNGAVSAEEIEKMASLLREADISNETSVVEYTMEEKIAEALILNQTMQAIGQVQDESEKVANFRDKAISAGYNAEDVDALLEKEARMSMWGSLAKSPVAKVIGATATLGAAGAIGHEVGESRTEVKARKAIKSVGRQAFVAGNRFGTRRGFVRGANASSEYYKRKLRQMRQGK